MFLALPVDRSARAQRPRILAHIGLAVFTMLATTAAYAQGVSYTVRIEAPRPLTELLEENLDLVRWRGDPRLDRDQLQRPGQAGGRILSSTEENEGGVGRVHVLFSRS